VLMAAELQESFGFEPFNPAQFCFLADPRGVLRVATSPIPVYQTHCLTWELAELEACLVEKRRSGDDPFFDDIVSHWFTSQIAAPSYPRHLYQELLAPGATVWNGYCGLEPDEVDQKTTLWTMEVARVDSAHANRLISDAVTLFKGIMADLDDYWCANDRLWNEGGYDYRGQCVVIYDGTLPRRFRKQLAIEGVLTRTQYDCLSEAQLRAIQNVRVPRKVYLPDHEDSLWEMLQLVG